MSWRMGLAAIVLAAIAMASGDALTQAVAPTNSAPNPYRAIYDWAKMPETR